MNADPRRPEKVQRYVPKANNGSGQEDLTPDYMNILDIQPVTDEVAVTTNATNVIPTSPQYGVAIIPNAMITTTNDIATETYTPPTETVTDTTAKSSDEAKELHSTPSRNDRFKVVKIASLEPFKRGRWKCMDYVDEAPPAGTNRVPQSAGSIQVAGGPYMQTQSLPQQQIQQMLIQSGFSNGTQFFPNIPAQMIPQGQYFYPQVNNVQNPSLGQQVPSSMSAQFISTQPYFAAGVVQNAAGFSIPQTYQTLQYVPANLVQNQNSAFVPTSQTVQIPANFQSQTYAGQPNVSQANVAQPVVNGHNFTPQNEQVTGSVPAQSAKSVILNSNQQSVVSQTQIAQQNIQNSIPVQNSQPAPVIQGQQFQQGTYQQTQSQGSSQVAANVTPVQTQSSIPVPQVFPMNVNSLTVFDNSENMTDATEPNSGMESVSENTDDPAKTNPVVNAIDNKIEQAMDLIAELMERIQQLETENNFLRSQIPKSQTVGSTTAASNPTQTQASTILTNPSPNFIPTSNANTVTTPQTNTPITNPSHNPISNTQTHSLPSGDPASQQQ
ncbi:hypothetical protein NQ317_010255 [Molorchus minor]|uniref:Protein Asterix n=1 Tax=Molorchus minor TaxID=1323400 RepID=A0ABQ9JE98_9CUCU|nr:hypothetical protein NQ317_010255 [Molorchus minor]